MAVMAFLLPLDQIAVAAGVIFLLLFTQVNISVITIRKMHGDRLDHGFKTPLFPAVPIIGIFLKIGLALYLLATQPLSWGIAVLWVLVGFVIYRMYTFKQEINHYAPVITSEGDLARKDFGSWCHTHLKILIGSSICNKSCQRKRRRNQYSKNNHSSAANSTFSWRSFCRDGKKSIRIIR
jgi:C-terminus of AA_permease